MAEEARVSADLHRENRVAVVNGDIRVEAISDPDNKFQKAIAAWRGMFKSVSICSNINLKLL